MRKTRKYRIFFGKRLVQNFEHRTDYRKHMKFEQEMGRVKKRAIGFARHFFAFDY